MVKGVSKQCYVAHLTPYTHKKKEEGCDLNTELIIQRKTKHDPKSCPFRSSVLVSCSFHVSPWREELKLIVWEGTLSEILPRSGWCVCMPVGDCLVALIDVGS